MGNAPFVRLGDYVQEEGLKRGALVDGLRLRFWDRGILSLWSGDVASCPIRQTWADVLCCRDGRLQSIGTSEGQ